ncbi:MAG: efflux RND transporter periplasmic adaptor subunit [Magnetococcus sp. DMHC-6]
MIPKNFLSAVLSLLLAGSLTPSQEVQAEEVSNTYPTITVGTGAIGTTTTLGGTVVPFKEVAFSAQLPGRVEFIAGVEGDWFRQNTVLVALNQDDLLAQYQSARAALANAEANINNARVQYTRQVYAGSQQTSDDTGMGMPKLFDQMFTKPFTSMAGTDSPELARRAQIYAQGTQIDQARFGLVQAKARLQELEARLRDTQSIAPFSGVIIGKHVEKGDTVQPGMPLLAFADTRQLQIKIDIPARLMPGIKKDMIIPAKLDVGDTKIQTKVTQIYPMADTQRHTVTVKLDLPKDAPGGPGMYAEVMVPDVTAPIKNLPTIPKSAVAWRGSLPAVFAIGNNKEPELRMIRLGGFVDDETVSVLSGLQAGEQILAKPPKEIATEWNTPTPSGH